MKTYSTSWLRTYLAAFLVAALTLGQAVRAQAPDWQWAVQSAMQTGIYPAKTASAPNGDIVITGYYYGTLTLGALPPVAGSGRSMFVAKMSSSGQWLWAIGVSASNGTFGTGIHGTHVACTPAGDVLITGGLQGTAQFSNHTLTSSSPYITGIVGKISGSTGQWLWVAQTGGPDVAAVAAAPGGEVVVGGGFVGSARIASLPAFTSSGDEDLYVAALDGTTGQWQWALAAGGSGRDALSDLAVTTANDVVLTGTFEGQDLALGANITLTASGRVNTYVAKLALSLRQWRWGAVASCVPNATLPRDLYCSALAANPAGDVTITGGFQGSAQFGSLPALSPPSSNRGGYVARLNGNTGQWEWAVAMGGVATDLDLAADGEAMVAGFFLNNAAFGSLPPLNNPGYNSYVAKIGGSTPEWRWATYGPNGNGVDVCLALPRGNQPVLASSFHNTVRFGALPALSTTSRNPIGPSGDMFVVSLNQLVSSTSGPGLISNFSVYPNPATGQFTLLLPGALGAASTATLFNSLGQAVRQQLVPAQATELVFDVRGLAPGLYSLFLPLGPEAVKYPITVH